MQQGQSLSELLTKSLKALIAYLKAEASLFLRRTGKKAGLFAGAIGCAALALVYLSIGLVRLLALYVGEIAAYFLIGAVLVLVCALLFSAASKKEEHNESGEKTSKDSGA